MSSPAWEAVASSIIAITMLIAVIWTGLQRAIESSEVCKANARVVDTKSVIRAILGTARLEAVISGVTRGAYALAIDTLTMS